MIIVFTEHALDRMEQRGITEDEIRRVLSRTLNATRGLRGEMRAEGLGHGRMIKVVYHEKKDLRIIITAWVAGYHEEGRG